MMHLLLNRNGSVYTSRKLPFISIDQKIENFEEGIKNKFVDNNKKKALVKKPSDIFLRS